MIGREIFIGFRSIVKCLMSDRVKVEVLENSVEKRKMVELRGIEPLS